LAQLSFAFSNINGITLDKPIAALTSANVNSSIYIAPGTISVTTSYNSSSYVNSLNNIYACNSGSASSPSSFYIVEKFSNNTSSVSFTVTAPNNFEVSSDGRSYYSSINSSATSGLSTTTLKTSKLYVRVKSNVTGTPTGTITISSSDGASFNLGVSATVMDIPTGTANDGYIVGSSVTISVTVTSYSGSTNTVKWYSSLTSTSSLRTGTSYPITNISTTKTYYASISAKANNVTCNAASRVAVVAYAGASLTTSVASLTGFATCQGTASSNQSFTVNGAGVSSNITITAPTGYEVSKTSGSGYASTITLTASNSILPSTSIYTRLSSSAIGTPTGTITINAGGTLSKTITVSGTASSTPSSPVTYDNTRYGSGSITLSATVTAGATADWYNALTGGTLLQSSSLTYSPTITQTTSFYVEARTTLGSCLSASRTLVTASVGSQITVSSNALDAFSTCANSASSSKSFTVSGAGIVGTITLTAPSNFEISRSSSSGYSSTLSLTASSNTVANTTIYARLTSSATGTPTGTITITSSGASSQNVSVSGTVNVLPVATAVTGSGNGTERINIGVTVSPSGTADWYTTSTTTNIISGATGTLSYTTPYLTSTTHYWALARNATTGCVAASRTDVAALVSPIITSSTYSLTGFSSCYGSSSEPQKFKVSASALSGSLTVLPSSGYEVSYSYNSNYTSSLTIAPSSYAKIDEKEIYVRLTGTISGTITGTVTLSATSATSKTISLTGVVSEPTVAGTISYTVTTSGLATLTLIGYKGDDFKWEESEHKRGKSDEVEGRDDYRDHDEDDDDEKKHNENFHEHEDGEDHHGSRVENTYTITRTITKSNSYRVTVKNGYCKAEITPATVANYRATPYPPIGYDNARTGSGTVTISATVDAGETVDWYAASTGGVALASSTLTYTTGVINSTTTYYAESRVGSTNVKSLTRTAVTATIGNPFAVSVTGNLSDYVYVKLTAIGSSVSPTTYYWTGGTTPNSATNKFYNSGTYTVYATANGQTVSKTVTVSVYVTGVTRNGEITEVNSKQVNKNGSIAPIAPVNFEGKVASSKQSDSIAYISQNLILNLDAGNSSSYPGTGTTWTDLSGNGVNATFGTGAHAPTYSSSYSGVFNFNRADKQYLTLGSVEKLTYSNTPFSINAWAKVTAAGGGYCEWVVSYGSANTNQARFLGTCDGYFQFGGYNGVDIQGSLMPINTWFNIAGTYDGTTAILYVDGIEMNRGARSWNTIQNIGYVGTQVNNSEIEYWDGSISNIQIYNKALTATDVLNNYNALRSRFGVATVNETTTVTSISGNSATSGGSINYDGGSNITARGVVWSTSQWPTILVKAGITSDGTGTGSFTSSLTGLTYNTTYYVRAYATNSNGTFYGPQTSFTTLNIVTSGLVLNLDAGNSLSYPGTGTTWTDLSGSNNGTITNVTYTASPGYFSFNGTSSRIDFSSGITSGDYLTYETWVNPTSLSGYSVIANSNSWSTGYVHFQFHSSSPSFDLYGGGDRVSTATYSLNTWYHLVAVYSNVSHTLTFYTNGVLTNTISSIPSVTIANTPFTIGAWNSGGFSRFYNGKISTFRAYNIALDATQVLQNYNALKSRFGY
jgi:hypothetical protein